MSRDVVCRGLALRNEWAIAPTAASVTAGLSVAIGSHEGTARPSQSASQQAGESLVGVVAPQWAVVEVEENGIQSVVQCVKK